MTFFNFLDLNNDGFVEIEEFKNKLNPAKHPAVLEGRKAEKQIQEELYESLELFITAYGKGPNFTKFTKEDFIFYYTNISASIENDEYFGIMLKNCWNMEATVAGESMKINLSSEPEKATAEEKMKSGQESRSSPFKKTVAEHSLEQSIVKEIKEVKVDAPYFTQEEEKQVGNIYPGVTFLQKTDILVLNRFRTAVISRGIRGIFGIERQFKVYAKNQLLELEDFIKTAEDFHLNVDPKVNISK